MQTFVPFPDFAASAVVLDSRRLGKQRVETFQILRALVWPTYGWKNHPATRMWRGFVPALVCYGLAVCDEWEARGHSDATRSSLLEFTGGTVPVFGELVRAGHLPPWFGQDAVHRSHRSALVRKEPEHYRAYFPDVPDDLPYVWPSAAFPRWPVRRGADPLEPAEAAALLGLGEVRDFQREAIEAVRSGRSVRLTAPTGSGATTTGLLAALCTPGPTVWVTPGPVPGAVPLPRRPDLPAPRSGKISDSIARAPDAAAAAAMAAEAAAEAEFRFLRPAQVDGEALSEAGLVVLDDGASGAFAAGAVPVLELLPGEADGPIRLSARAASRH